MSQLGKELLSILREAKERGLLELKPSWEIVSQDRSQKDVRNPVKAKVARVKKTSS